MSLTWTLAAAASDEDLEVAVELLLSVVADTSADAHVAAYRDAIRFYACDIERTWT